MIQPGTLLQNRYRVAEQIGKGGMGEVYLATDERFQSTVAVKRTVYDDPEMCRAFAREARLLNRLRHAALPKVSDHFSEGGDQFLVMEFIEGADLSELLKQRKVPFPLADVLRWADQLLDALEYLHAQQPPVIHRDIKPQNIKLTPRGSVVLLDFGLAKGLPSHTASGPASSVFGYSLNFAPLEQMQGAGTDARSDLYSLAATLYFLLTAVRPPDALTRAAATVKQQPDPLRPAHLIQAQVPAAVGQILQRAMSQNAPLRHASATDLRAALRQAAGDAVPRDAFAQKPDSPAHKKGDANSPSQILPTHTEPTLLSSLVQPRASQPRVQSPSSSDAPQPASHESDSGLTPDSLRRQRAYDSRTISARVAPQRSGPASYMTPALVACFLVACAASAAYFFTRTPAPRAPAAAVSNTTQDSPPQSQQTDPAGQSKPPAGGPASDAPNAAPDSDASAKSVPARPAADASSPAAQSSADPASSHTAAQPNTNATTTNPSGMNETAAAPGGRPALVIQNPAPVEDKRSADDSRREQSDESRREQPASRPDYADRPPPGPAYPPPGYPPPPDDRRPPPPDGRRPPPQSRPPLP
jgi:serine/threonine protein kinase